MQRLTVSRGLGALQRRILDQLQNSWREAEPTMRIVPTAELFRSLGLSTYAEQQSARRAVRGLIDREFVGVWEGLLTPPGEGDTRQRRQYRMAADRDAVAQVLTSEWQAASAIRDALGLETYRAKRAIRQLCDQQRAELWQDPAATAPTIRDWLVRRPEQSRDGSDRS